MKFDSIVLIVVSIYRMSISMNIKSLAATAAATTTSTTTTTTRRNIVSI